MGWLVGDDVVDVDAAVVVVAADDVAAAAGDDDVAGVVEFAVLGVNAAVAVAVDGHKLVHGWIWASAADLDHLLLAYCKDSPG